MHEVLPDVPSQGVGQLVTRPAIVSSSVQAPASLPTGYGVCDSGSRLPLDAQSARKLEMLLQSVPGRKTENSLVYTLHASHLMV